MLPSVCNRFATRRADNPLFMLKVHK